MVGTVRRYTFMDLITQVYLGGVGVLVLVFHGERIANWAAYVSAHAAVMVLIHLLIRASARAGPVVSFLRHLYPLVLLTAMYCETARLNRMFVSEFQDPWFIRLEAVIFGCQPSLLFMEQVPSLLLSELLYAAYASFYVMIAGIGLGLYWRNREHYLHYAGVLLAVFYVCYAIFIFLPVVGPPIFYQEIRGYSLPPDVRPALIPPYPEVIRGGLCFALMELIYSNLEKPGAGFPSSHVAAALVTLRFSFRYLKPIRWVHTLVVGLLIVATVYCRYHYVVDVAAGILAAALLLPAAEWAARGWHSRPKAER